MTSGCCSVGCCLVWRPASGNASGSGPEPGGGAAETGGAETAGGGIFRQRVKVNEIYITKRNAGNAKM